MTDLTGSEVRCWVYRQVAALFGNLPEALPPLEEGHALGSVAEGAAGAALPRTYHRTRDSIHRLVEAFARQPREEIQAEQVRLFVNAPGGVPAPPYASWYLDGTLLGESTLWVAQQYRGQALEVAPDAGEPADFIGTEMEYMYFLCRHARAARLTGDRAALDSLFDAEGRFFRSHLARWLRPFVQRVRAAAPDGVYARVAGLLEAFCLDEEDRLGLEPSSTPGEEDRRAVRRASK